MPVGDYSAGDGSGYQDISYPGTVSDSSSGVSSNGFMEFVGQIGTLFSPSPVIEPYECSQDAMQCPDGSFVGRSGPHCQFVCPAPCESCDRADSDSSYVVSDEDSVSIEDESGMLEESKIGFFAGFSNAFRTFFGFFMR
jgi:hypothetical protein